MPDGITLRVLGDYGPFSRMGKSIGYQITVGHSSYLIDCGAPLFQQIGGQGIKEIKGLIITHCHDDHKRWFSDLALFSRYAPDVAKKIFLLTSEDVYHGLLRSGFHQPRHQCDQSAAPALEEQRWSFGRRWRAVLRLCVRLRRLRLRLRGWREIEYMSF